MPPDLWEPCRAEVRAELARRRVTYTAFAAQLGIHAVSLGRILNGHHDGTVQTWARIAAELGMHFELHPNQRET
jgi:plasmid maintenance system antidote protein VapI